MINGINHITLAVKEIERSFYFYKEILSLKPLCKWHQGAYFLVEGLWFCLNVDEKREINPCYTHYAFSVAERDFEKVCDRVISSGVIIFKDNSSPGKSLYFLDPDGHKLELHVGNWQTRVEAKKANPGSWQKVEWYI